MVGNRRYLTLETTNTPVVRPVDGSPIVLIVAAVDGGVPSLSATAQIRIAVVDTNMHAPRFLKSNYEAIIQENTQFRVTVLAIHATDLDRGVNGEFYYYLKEPSPYFAVNPSNGRIWVVGELNYAQSPYNLKISAQDRGLPRRTSSTTATIRIRSDIPDYPQAPIPIADIPIYFPKGPYYVDIFENYPVGGLLTIVKAEQEGIETNALNAAIRYSLSGDNDDYIKIDPTNGVITLAKNVDYETKLKRFELKITATLQGVSSALSSSTEFKADVQDSSDNQYRPVFNSQFKHVTINENVPIGHTVTTVSATDNDVGPAGEVIYSMVDGTGLGIFEIGNSSGIVKTANFLDYEKQT